MRILVLSDTHIENQSIHLPSIIEKEARQSDYCLHCGDFTDFSIFESLNSWAKTYGVCGNMDNGQIRKSLPLKQTFTINGINFGLIHGRGNPANIIDYINHEFSSELNKLDIIVFGHSHCKLNKEIDKRIYFNPGSPTDSVYAIRRSYGILEIESGKLKRRIIDIG